LIDVINSPLLKAGGEDDAGLDAICSFVFSAFEF
jgi:hypothetical protein